MVQTEIVDTLPSGVAADEVLLVWRPLATTAGELATFAATLTSAERAVAARYHFQVDRDRSVVSRGTLRALLARVLGRPAATIELVVGEYGKPALVGAELELNVSHADAHLLIGLSRARAIGVDVEGGGHALDVNELAPRVFTAIERAELAQYAGAARRAAFLRAWTRKEAYLKARAVGLSLPLTDFSVSLSADGVASLSSTVDPVEAARWQLAGLAAPPGSAAAACWSREAPEVRRLVIATFDGQTG